MASIIGAIFAIALLLAGSGLIASGSLNSWNRLSSSYKDMQVFSGNITRTGVSVIAAQATGSNLEVTVQNIGQTTLYVFSAWDVFVQYYAAGGVYQQRRLTYTASAPGNNQWTVKGVYLNAASSTPEVFEPNILNPGEQMVIQATLSPALAGGFVNQVVLSTENGVVTEGSF